MSTAKSTALISVTQIKPVHVDGVLDDESWMNAERTGLFQRVTPTDTGFAIAQTEVMLTYDKSNIYVGIICHDPTKGKSLSNHCEAI